MPIRRHLIALLAAAAASACTAPPAFAVGGLVDLQVIDRQRGDTLATYRSRGASYVAGRPGDRYAVRMTNRSSGRVLVVLSVDGVNAVSGETASTGQTGYVLAPHASADITGWRKSYSEAAAFYFTALPDSYAARTDRPDNVGVIGTAVFRERERERDIRRPWRNEAPPIVEGRIGQGDAASAGAADAPQSEAGRQRAASPMAEDSVARQDKKLGTGHGEREYSPTAQTAFERASEQPAEVVQIRYDSYSNLVASGVIGRSRPNTAPVPFPGFVRDPW